MGIILNKGALLGEKKRVLQRFLKDFSFLKGFNVEFSDRETLSCRVLRMINLELLRVCPVGYLKSGV